METNNEFILESIGSKVARILHKYYYEEPSLICDNGNGNVLTLDGVALRYDFLDTPEIEERSEMEEQKLKFLRKKRKYIIMPQLKVLLLIIFQKKKK